MANLKLLTNTTKAPSTMITDQGRVPDAYPVQNQNISPEATLASQNGTMTGGQTTSQLPAADNSSSAGNSVVGQNLATSLNASSLPTSTSLQLGGMGTSAATDTMGSKLVESLQGAKTTQMDEIANQLAAHGITGGQATSQLAKANRDYMLGMSQGLGQFNINRLSQAASINRDFLQLELQRQLGLGQLELGSRELDTQIAIKLSEMAQYADTQTRNEIQQLMTEYFGGQEI